MVEASNSTITKTYTILVNRASPSTNALLTSIKTTPTETLTMVSGPGFGNYTTQVSNGITSLQITAIVQDTRATIEVNGVAAASGTPSAPIPLVTGANKIITRVTAEDGVTVNDYIITVTRAMNAVNDVYEQATVVSQTDKLQNDGITVHRGISPNGDGIDDVFTIDGLSQYPDNKLTIINRNGAVLFEGKNYDAKLKVFDGHSGKTGALAQAGTYFYLLDYKVNGQSKYKTGFIILKY